jgi:hypothetical protein
MVEASSNRGGKMDGVCIKKKSKSKISVQELKLHFFSWKYFGLKDLFKAKMHSRIIVLDFSAE